MTLGGFVRHRMAVLGINQTDLVKRSGKSPAWINDIVNERRVSLPSPDELEELAQALDCTVPDMLQAAGYLPVPELVSDDKERLTLYLWLDALAQVEDIDERERAFIGRMARHTIEEYERVKAEVEARTRSQDE